jgi:hypothetical protein
MIRLFTSGLLSDRMRNLSPVTRDDESLNKHTKICEGVGVGFMYIRRVRLCVSDVKLSILREW